MDRIRKVRFVCPLFWPENKPGLLLQADEANDEYRIGMWDGVVRSYSREEFEIIDGQDPKQETKEETRAAQAEARTTGDKRVS